MKQKLQNQTQQTKIEGGVVMEKLTQAQQNQAQTQQVQQNQEGGGAMEKLTQTKQTQQGGVYFITFAHKVNPEKAKEVLVELRKQFPMQFPIFTRRPPRGKRIILQICEELVILTFPYENKQKQLKQEQAPTQVQEEGFKLRDLLKNKKV